MLFQKESSARERWCITSNTREWEMYILSKRATYPLKRAIYFHVLSKRAICQWEMMYHMQHKWMRAIHPLKKSHASSPKEPYIHMFFREEPSAHEKWCITCHTCEWEPCVLSNRAAYPLEKSHIFLCCFKKSHLPVRNDASHAAQVNESRISSQKEPRILSKRAIYSYVPSKESYVSERWCITRSTCE